MSLTSDNEDTTTEVTLSYESYKKLAQAMYDYAESLVEEEPDDLSRIGMSIMHLFENMISEVIDALVEADEEED